MKDSTYTVCPQCGSQAILRSTPNPIRNVIRDHVKCPRCKFEKVAERAPDTTIADWMKTDK